MTDEDLNSFSFYFGSKINTGGARRTERTGEDRNAFSYSFI